ncbi:hypothetical protein CMI37_04805 [Candidatus Pacearchaeota archaeon]|nr:hypothetical protein [Candidatus Pacearchaeota archaeon]|tara:strand:- start:142 stop:324 length:183 start_codon:yes stop_codon:yes gene_type:complete
MKNELKNIIKDTLSEYSDDGEGNQANLSSFMLQDILSEEIEKRIKRKFHIFRINRLLTDD